MTRDERGAAPVEFVLVGIVLSGVFLAVLQLGIDLHLRNVLSASAAEGARFGANADRDPIDAADRTRELVTESTSARYAANVTADVAELAGAPVVEVTVRAQLPLVFGWLPAAPVTVRGHALLEPRAP